MDVNVDGKVDVDVDVMEDGIGMDVLAFEIVVENRWIISEFG